MLSPAVVLGLNPNALGTIRSLYGHGFDIIALDRRPTSPIDTHRWMSSRTRLCRKIYVSPERWSDSVVGELIELGESLPAPGVLFPSADEHVAAMSAGRAELAPLYRFALPADETIRLVADKSAFQGWAEERGFAVPRTLHPVTTENLTKLAADIRYPCVVKPPARDEIWDRRFPRDKVLVAADEGELVSHLREAQQVAGSLMVQEAVPGPDTALIFSHAYCDAESRILAMWTGRKIRQLPRLYGTSTFAETVRDDEVIRQTERLLEELRCIGYASVEFKLDPRDGAYRIMEVTLARTWYPHYLGTVAGVNLPLVWYRDLVRCPPEPPPRCRYGIRWVDEYRDLVTSAEYVRSGSLSFGSWLASYRRTRAFALASFRDPAPALFIVLRLMLSAWNVARRLLLRFLRGTG